MERGIAVIDNHCNASTLSPIADEAPDMQSSEPSRSSPNQQRLVDMQSTSNVAEHLGHLDRLANIGTLSASVAHEIKNALVASKTFIDLLLEKNRDTEMATLVRRELSRIEALVNEMLRFSGSIKPSFAEVRIHDVLEHSLVLVQPQLQSKSIALKREFAAANDLIPGDERQLEQAFVNLLLNACDATAPSGSVMIKTELAQPVPPAHSASPPAENGTTLGATHLRISIQDSGLGIEPEAMPRLFEPFFTTKETGTGLGLAITRRILQEHGGSIAVESQPGKGATFVLELPLAENA